MRATQQQSIADPIKQSFTGLVTAADPCILWRCTLTVFCFWGGGACLFAVFFWFLVFFRPPGHQIMLFLVMFTAPGHQIMFFW